MPYDALSFALSCLPFAGALLGELSSGNSVLRATHVGVGTWLGLLFGTLLKLCCRS